MILTSCIPRKKAQKDTEHEELEGVLEEDQDCVSEDWPKGLYTQQIQEVLPPLLTDYSLIPAIGYASLYPRQ